MYIKVKNLSLTYYVNSLNQSYLRKNFVNRLLGKSSINEIKKINALSKINLDLKVGDRLGIIGPNGSGKSTLIKCLSGIIYPDQGSFIEIEGKYLPIIEPNSLSEITDTVENNIILIGLLLGFEKKFIQDKKREILIFSELSEYKHSAYSVLSTGMKLKLIFSIVFLLGSDIFIIDEFLTTGDERFRKKGYKLLEDSKNNESIVVLCSHDRMAIKDYCNKILVLNEGKQVYLGEIEEGYKIYDEIMEKK